MNRTRLAVAIATSLALAACGGSTASSGGSTTAHDEHEQATQAAASPVVAPGEARVGDTTTCPVSGETFVVSDASPHVDYEGRTYYFCCPGCDQRFQADPAHYVHPAATDATTAPPS